MPRYFGNIYSHRLSRQGKFNAKKTEYEGETYDSGLEARYAMVLADQRKWDEITGFERQVKYQLLVNNILICTHVVDFRVTYPDGHTELHEVKGYATPQWRIKVKLFRALFPDLIYRVIGPGLTALPLK